MPQNVKLCYAVCVRIGKLNGKHGDFNGYADGKVLTFLLSDTQLGSIIESKETQELMWRDIRNKLPLCKLKDAKTSK